MQPAFSISDLVKACHMCVNNLSHPGEIPNLLASCEQERKRNSSILPSQRSALMAQQHQPSNKRQCFAAEGEAYERQYQRDNEPTNDSSPPKVRPMNEQTNKQRSDAVLNTTVSQTGVPGSSWTMPGGNCSTVVPFGFGTLLWGRECLPDAPPVLMNLQCAGNMSRHVAALDWGGRGANKATLSRIRTRKALIFYTNIVSGPMPKSIKVGNVSSTSCAPDRLPIWIGSGARPRKTI
jgi:hypothetical protein